MVSNINLLPKQEDEQSSSLVLILVVIMVLLGLGLVSYMKMQELTSQTTDLSKQLTVAKVKLETQQKTATTVSSSPADLEKAAKTLADGQVKLLPVLTKMTSFLPDRAVFVSFTYKESNAITTEIRFDDKQSAAYYYSRLTGEPWIQEAKLVSVKAQDVQKQQTTTNQLPRYIAQYDLVIVKDKVKELEKEGSK